MMMFQTFHRFEAKQISCARINIYDYTIKLLIKDCIMDFSTSMTIESPNMSIFTRDNSMERLIMDHNKKIFYLPDKIGDAYVNLKVIRAHNCSVKDIFKGNFKGLTKLNEIYLDLNQIEKITSDTFEGLTKLEVLSLSLKAKITNFQNLISLLLISAHNRMKYLNGKAFRLFTNTIIRLKLNDCIDQSFTTKFGPSILVEITEKCGYVEMKPKLEFSRKQSRISKKTVTTVTYFMLESCGALICILLGLVFYRKLYHEKSSRAPPRPINKITTLADLTISEMVIAEIKPTPVNDDDSSDLLEDSQQRRIEF